jgi:hypothetical protein
LKELEKDVWTISLYEANKEVKRIVHKGTQEPEIESGYFEIIKAINVKKVYYVDKVFSGNWN